MPSLENKFSRLTDLPPIPALLMEAIDQINGKQDLTILADKISQDRSMTIRILLVYTANLLIVKVEQPMNSLWRYTTPFALRLPCSMFQSLRRHIVLAADGNLLTRPSPYLNQRTACY